MRLLSVGVLLCPDSYLAWAEETLGFWLAVWKDNDDIWQQLELNISYQKSQKLMCAQLWSAVSLLPESPSRHLCPGCPSPPHKISHLHPHALSSLAEEGTILPVLLAKSTAHFLSPWTQLRFLTVNLCWRWPFWIDTQFRKLLLPIPVPSRPVRFWKREDERYSPSVNFKVASKFQGGDTIGPDGCYMNKVPKLECRKSTALITRSQVSMGFCSLIFQDYQ